jgi:replicative DNA helicase
MRSEDIILGALLHSEPYSRRVLPYVDPEYFSDNSERRVFKYIAQYIVEYNNIPNKTTLLSRAHSDDKLGEEHYERVTEIINGLQYDDTTDEDWLVNLTERFCQEKAVYNAIMKSIGIINGEEKKLDKGAIPELLTEALGVSFDATVGHDYIEDAEKRYLEYTEEKERIPFDMEMFNTITNGGLIKKTLNIVMGGTGAGKTLGLCHFASSHLTMGKNVLYITLEIAEERIAERIDANLLNVPMDSLRTLTHDAYTKRIERLQEKTRGKLIIKEYPTGAAGCNHFRHLLNELNLKRKFKPDVIYIDYINLCTSSRVRMGSVNSYGYVKAVSEEIRGLAIEYNVPIMSATQFNRSGFTSSDPGLDDVAESFGLAVTGDLIFALISSDELESLGQMMVKQMKSRYRDPAKNRKFVIGVDKDKMRLFDVEQSAHDEVIDIAQDNVSNSRPTFDKEKFAALFGK